MFLHRVIVKQEKGKKNSDFLIPKSNSTRPLPITIGNDNVAEIYGPEYGLIYLLKTPQDPLLHIHLYECEKYEQVSLYITHQILKFTYEDMKKRWIIFPKCMLSTTFSQKNQRSYGDAWLLIAKLLIHKWDLTPA